MSSRGSSRSLGRLGELRLLERQADQSKPGIHSGQQRELSTLELLQPGRFSWGNISGSPFQCKRKLNGSEDKGAGTKCPEQQGQGLRGSACRLCLGCWPCKLQGHSPPAPGMLQDGGPLTGTQPQGCCHMMIPTDHRGFCGAVFHQEPDVGLAYGPLRWTTGVLSTTLPLGADAGAVSTHPQDLKAQDTHNMARGSGLEGRLVTLDKLSQMDVGQGGAGFGLCGEAQDLHRGGWPETTVDNVGPGNPFLQLAKEDAGSWKESYLGKQLWIFDIYVQVRGIVTVIHF